MQLFVKYCSLLFCRFCEKAERDLAVALRLKTLIYKLSLNRLVICSGTTRAGL